MRSHCRVTRVIFSKKAKSSVTKGQKWPTKLLKQAKRSIKNGQKCQILHLIKPNLVDNLPAHNSNSHKNTSCVLTVPPQTVINSKLFSELVTYDRKMPKCFTLQKYLNINRLHEKSTVTLASSLKF